jgi:hypothetical protein
VVLVLYGLSLKWYWYFGMTRWLGVSSEIDGIMRRLHVKQRHKTDQVSEYPVRLMKVKTAWEK